MTIKITMDNRTMFRAMSVIVGFGLTLLAIYIARNSLFLIVIAFFLAIALSPPVNMLSKRLPWKSRGLATAIAYLSIVTLLGTILFATVPTLVKQSQNLINNLPEYVEQLEESDSIVARTARDLNAVDTIKASEAEISERLANASGPVLNTISNIVTNVAGLVIVLVMTFFMLVEGPAWVEKFFQLQPKDKQKHRRELAEKMYKVVTGYVNGQLIVASLSASFSFVILTILQVDYALPLAAIVGIFGLIPLVGAFAGSMIVLSVALFKSIFVALILLIYFIVYQFMENNVIQPMVQSKTLDMSPLMILIAVIIGVNVAGLLGAVLSIPIAASLRILINDYLHRHNIEPAIHPKK